jgi:hypothetical protein
MSSREIAENFVKHISPGTLVKYESRVYEFCTDPEGKCRYTKIKANEISIFAE